MPTPPRTLGQAPVSRQFEAFARECRGTSPLYERLALSIADDPEILALATHTRKDERIPNLFLASIRFLLLKGTPHGLAKFYESGFGAGDDPYPVFRAFCLEHAARIIEVISTRAVQTNEVSRSALLLPALVRVSHQAEGRPLYLLEIGAAAGLILLWDRYGYDYGNGVRSGDPDSPVQIQCELRGPSTPPIPATPPAVCRRIGVDLNPIDIDDTEQTLWLRSLVWPGNEKRAELLENALAVARRDKPKIVKGDGVALLPGLLADVPAEAALCIIRIFTNLPPEARDRYNASISRYGAQRDLWAISTRSGARNDESTLALGSYRNGVRNEALLSRCENHGRWLEWLMES